MANSSNTDQHASNRERGLKIFCKSITKVILAPDKHGGRNPPQPAKSWNQPIFHAVVYENTSCCGQSWTCALTQSTSLGVTGATRCCLYRHGEVEQKYASHLRGVCTGSENMFVCCFFFLLIFLSSGRIITAPHPWPKDESCFNVR